jgi:hypothetical protein
MPAIGPGQGTAEFLRAWASLLLVDEFLAWGGA